MNLYRLLWLSRRYQGDARAIAKGRIGTRLVNRFISQIGFRVIRSLWIR